MLDGLDEIEWRRLGHAYGAADDVPGYLRDLTSPDPDVRMETLGSLYTTIVHQGNRFQASAYAVPFLLELLADPAVPERGDVVGLLAALAIGQDATVLPDGVPAAAFRRAAEGGRELLAAKPPPSSGGDGAPKEYVEYTYLESLTEDGRNRLWAYTHLAVYDAVRAGVPLLRRLLDEADPGLHVPAAYALAWFPEEAAGSLPALAGAMAGAGPAGTASMLVAGGLLGAAPDIGLLDDPDPRVRWAAAVGRARVLGARADEVTAETLAQATGPWLIDGVEFGNVSMLVAEHGLPRSRVALRGYLDQGPASVTCDPPRYQSVTSTDLYVGPHTDNLRDIEDHPRRVVCFQGGSVSQARLPRRRRVVLAAGITATAVVTSLLALPQPAMAAGGPYRATAVPVTTPQAAGDVAVIPGAYVVTLKPGADATVPARALKAAPSAYFSRAVNGFAARLTAAQVAELAHNANVVSIERDVLQYDVVDATQTNPPAWGIDRIDQTTLPLSRSYTYNSTGTGVHAYVIDSGIQANHPDFGGRAQFAYNAIDTNNTDCNGHGTHVAGTIGGTSHGVAKNVRLYGVKWLNCSGGGTLSAAIGAVDWVTRNANKPAVANASWNYTYSASLATALTNMMNSGVFLAASAGNTGGNSCDRLPRNLTAALVVAATTNTDARASYSSVGSCVDIYAPGSGILSTYPTSTTASLNGTSMATPHAAGVAALWKATNGDASQATVHNWIVANGTSGVVTGSLSGTPNLLLNKKNL